MTWRVIFLYSEHMKAEALIETRSLKLESRYLHANATAVAGNCLRHMDQPRANPPVAQWLGNNQHLDS